MLHFVYHIQALELKNSLKRTVLSDMQKVHLYNTQSDLRDWRIIHMPFSENSLQSDVFRWVFK